MNCCTDRSRSSRNTSRSAADHNMFSRRGFLENAPKQYISSATEYVWRAWTQSLWMAHAFYNRHVYSPSWVATGRHISNSFGICCSKLLLAMSLQMVDSRPLSLVDALGCTSEEVGKYKRLKNLKTSVHSFILRIPNRQFTQRHKRIQCNTQKDTIRRSRSIFDWLCAIKWQVKIQTNSRRVQGVWN